MDAQSELPEVSSACRGGLFFLTDNPRCCDSTSSDDGAKSYVWIEDGVLGWHEGKITLVAEARDVAHRLPNALVINDYSGRIIMPGFIDAHTHYPQLNIMASYGDQLLHWLNHYTFPEEARFGDEAYAAEMADAVMAEMLRNGTTTASVFCTVHENSVDQFFKVAEKEQLRMIAGKVLMDRNAPNNLCEETKKGCEETRRLIQRWHGKGRLSYAITPRFAPTSTSEQLTCAGELLADYPDVFMQTHIAESVEEVDWVKTLFPNSTDYLQVYEQHGLMHDRSLLAHGIHLSNDELSRVAKTNASIVFCPSSNLFLGSGLFGLHNAYQHGVEVSIGSDVGAGTSFSMLKTLADAYKVGALRGESLPALQGFYMATLGNARALKLDDKIGSFKLGNEVDFVVLNESATPLIAQRKEQCRTLEERLFMLMILGDDRCVEAVWVNGERKRI